MIRRSCSSHGGWCYRLGGSRSSTTHNDPLPRPPLPHCQRYNLRKQAETRLKRLMPGKDVAAISCVPPAQCVVLRAPTLARRPPFPVSVSRAPLRPRVLYFCSHHDRHRRPTRVDLRRLLAAGTRSALCSSSPSGRHEEIRRFGNSARAGAQKRWRRRHSVSIVGPLGRGEGK